MTISLSLLLPSQSRAFHGRRSAFRVGLAALLLLGGGCGSDRPNPGPSDPSTTHDAGRDAGLCRFHSCDRYAWSVSNNPNPKRSSFSGGTFDGRYVYFTPSGAPGSVFTTRYDSQAPFDSESAWSVFNVAEVDGEAWRFAGAVFDGRYIYYAPTMLYATTSLAPVGGSVARYDTQGTFQSSSAWATFPLLSRLNLPIHSFNGAVFDGRYVYFVPERDLVEPSGRVVRYDSRAPFDDVASWTMFDITSIQAGARGFMGGTFDGRYLYLAPSGASAEAKGLVTRYDTQGKFDGETSWSTFDTTSIDPRVWGFSGATFDGRYVYFCAGHSGPIPHGRLVRFDTTSKFDDLASWATFGTGDLPYSAQGMTGPVFDGRYVHFLPGRSGGGPVSYDTQGDFSSPASWLSMSVSLFGIDFGAGAGGVFDGRYVYVIPVTAATVLRFEMKALSAAPGGRPSARLE
jgi:hypothetical protein